MSLRCLNRQLRVAPRPATAATAEAAAAAAQPAVEAAISSLEPALILRDEAVFLLHAAAEVEHMLMAQYLFAAYSLDESRAPTDAAKKTVKEWRRNLLNIAKEEMGHLLTVQNLLLLVGGPLHFEREEYPFKAETVYPFPFMLEPVSQESLGKYVLAEMPERIELSSEQEESVREIENLLGMGFTVNPVGKLYNRVTEVFQELRNSDFVSGIEGYQAKAEDWSANTASGNLQGELQVQIDTAVNRDEALAALERIATQGEGATPGAQEVAHFDRFLTIYRKFRDRGGWPATHRFPNDPSADQIVDPQARRWAHLFNLRYRLLLSFLSHSMRLAGPTTQSGTPTPRGDLVNWTFFEMRHLARIAQVLVQMPHGSGADVTAAPPFDLPYTLALPDRDVDRWRTHRDITTASQGLIEQIEGGALDEEQERVLRIVQQTNKRQSAGLDAYVAQQPLPPATGYGRVRRIFDEAVRGFAVPLFHKTFWREEGVPSGRLLNEQEFLQRDRDRTLFPGQFRSIITPGELQDSPLVQALSRVPPERMPLGRPMLSSDELEAVKTWIGSLPGEAGPGEPTGPGGEEPRTRFQKVLRILNDAVENQDIGAHGRFWTGKTRDEFVTLSVFGRDLVVVGNGTSPVLSKPCGVKIRSGPTQVPQAPSSDECRPAWPQ